MTTYVDRQEFQKGLASQKIYFFAPEGRPSATPSVGIKTKDGGILSASATTNVTLDPVTTTVSVSSSVKDTSINLTSVTNLRLGATYLLKNASGQYEWVRIKSLTNPVELDEELQYAYPLTTSTFQSTEFYYTLQTGDVSIFRDQNIATATYAVTGFTPTYLEVVFDVVYRPLNNPLTVERIKAEWPSIMRQDFIEQMGEDFRRQIEAAWQKVRIGLRQAGYVPGKIVDVGNVYEWALQEFGFLLQKNGVSVIAGIDRSEALTMQEKFRDRAMEAALRTIEWYDIDEYRSYSEKSEHRPLRLNITR